MQTWNSPIPLPSFLCNSALLSISARNRSHSANSDENARTVRMFPTTSSAMIVAFVPYKQAMTIINHIDG